MMRPALFNLEPQPSVVQSSAAKNRGKFFHIVDLASISLGIARFLGSGSQKNAFGPLPHLAALTNHLPVRRP
jgi:hypothetical protein